MVPPTPSTKEEPTMKRTCSAAGGLVFLGMLLSAVGLMAVPASAKCGKDCKHSLTSAFKACKAACEKGKAGKSCRKACSTEHRAAKAACKAASNPRSEERRVGKGGRTRW